MGRGSVRLAGVPYGGNLPGLTSDDRRSVDALEEPKIEALYEHHITECLRLGVSIVATDTFYSRLLLEEYGGNLRFIDLVRKHLKIVLKVLKKLDFPKTLIDIAIGPVGDCYLDDAHPGAAKNMVDEQIAGIGAIPEARGLIGHGRLGVLCETVASVDKLKGTVDGILSRFNKWPKGVDFPPCTVSLCVDSKGSLSGGENPFEVLHSILGRKEVRKLCLLGKLSFGLNCSTILGIERFYQQLAVWDVLHGTNYVSLFGYVAPNAASIEPREAETRWKEGLNVDKDPTVPGRLVELVKLGLVRKAGLCCGHGRCDHEKTAELLFDSPI